MVISNPKVPKHAFIKTFYIPNLKQPHEIIESNYASWEPLRMENSTKIIQNIYNKRIGTITMILNTNSIH